MSESSPGPIEAQRVVLLLVVNIVAGVALPVAIEFFSRVELELVDEAILAVLCTLALTVAELLYRIEQIYSFRTAEVELWEHRSGIDETLVEIRTGLHQLIADESLRDSFYLDHYRRELELLSSRVKTTTTTKEVLLDRHHIDSTEVLLSIYDLRDHTEFRATHCLSDVTDQFDATYQVYFFAWMKRLQAKKVRSLRRLFIYEDLGQFQHQNTRKLLAFHNSGLIGLGAKAISRDGFLRFKADYHILDGVEDFGIFSDQYIYLGQTRRDENIAGYFSRDKRQIRVYTQMFDALWDSRSAVPITNFVTDVISADDLFDPSKMLLVPGTPPERSAHPMIGASLDEREPSGSSESSRDSKERTSVSQDD